MNLPEILQWLEANKDERGIKIWSRLKDQEHQQGYFGLGLTKLKKFSSQVGKNHELALELWEQPYLDTKLLATFVEEPKKVTETQMNSQVKTIFNWILADKYCENIVAKTGLSAKLFDGWSDSSHEMVKRCAYTLAGMLAMKNQDLPEAWFEERLKECANLQHEANFVKDAMNMALMRIGSRTPGLHKQALDIAKSVGEVVVDYGDNSCMTPNALRALQNRAK